MITRRSVLAGAIGLAGTAAAQADDVTYFRILTGGTAGAYFPIGGLVASAISNPPAMVAATIASSGSVANVAAVEAGTAQSAFVQSDIAHWAYSGTGLYEGRPRIETLRAIANLYPESIQLVARKGSDIKSVADLRGKRVSLDEPGSGTLADARIILAAYGLSERELEAVYLPVQQAADGLRAGALDAFFNVSGWPQSTIADLAASLGFDLVPIAGPQAAALTARHKFFVAGVIPDNAYKGVTGAQTIDVHALWITSSKQPADLIYEITAALWAPATRKLLDSGPAIGRDIRLETALVGVSIPLHAGAERFYKEKGLIN
ncbi:TAXI family TRAP transporter solute-binding subunit [Enhydrobacter sp.]|jgi:TRAP transporter TAXI family solute receptor|uniref:TAXI family TRAP transporter solute-binding subunit n=1 Tax=Enhydrobacter sp. TaxID=1894999 RepID=UPI002639440F|nr:TAXI family TRAP transporter solute-binding subunit [Enhydrobacter sp.]WIM13780.1 MAG: TRAP transporter solute receptor, TAXI family precursor [Enhydrobacter sp.]